MPNRGGRRLDRDGVVHLVQRGRPARPVEAGEERGREHQARDVRRAARRMERDRPPEDAAEDRDHERQRQRQRDAHEALEREEQHRPGEEDETQGYDLHRGSRPPWAVAVEDVGRDRAQREGSAEEERRGVAVQQIHVDEDRGDRDGEPGGHPVQRAGEPRVHDRDVGVGTPAALRCRRDRAQRQHDDVVKERHEERERQPR